MAGINTKRVILGGLVAGLIINVSEYLLNGPVLGRELESAIQAHSLQPVGGGAMGVFGASGFGLGLLLVWLYAAVRPRFGPGPRTAVLAAVAFWLLAYLWPSVGLGLIGLFPWRLLTIGLVWGLAEAIVAALAGGWIYTEA